MPFIQVGSYAVRSSRGLGSSDALNFIRVVPTPFVGAGSGIEFVEFLYTAAAASTVGTIPAGVSPKRVFAFFPREEFENHRVVFQTEAPLEIEWEATSADPTDVQSVIVRTKQEPPGEGPTDTS
jgi:hypothetical protein